MSAAIKHRGPDFSGSWVTDQVALGSVRLAIVDPVANANQPMTSENERYTIVFNGEIYNFKEIRAELIAAGKKFKTNSDTEVVLQAYINWGNDSFNKFNGMWAFAIWDNQDCKLTCSVDRFGKKPFFWTVADGGFQFSSEVKSFLANGVALNTNLQYFFSYLHNDGIDSDTVTPVQEVYRLAAGNVLQIDAYQKIEITKWWKGFSPSTSIESANSHSKNFRETFRDAVYLRIPENQAFAISLSGGLDSSAVAAMTRQVVNESLGLINPGNVTCYTVDFGKSKINELESAQKTAEILKFEHKSIKIDIGHFRDTVTEITWHQESLVWNSAVVSFQALYRAISLDRNKVALEGHGSDEYLAGYPMYSRLAMQSAFKKLNFKDAIVYFKLLRDLSNKSVGEGASNQQISSEVRTMLSLTLDHLNPGRRIERNLSQLGGIFTDVFGNKMYQDKVYTSNFSGLLAHLDRAIHFETLPQILRVFDRVSMAEGVESRMPFLDYRLLDIAFRAGERNILGKSGSKVLLRAALSDIIPMHVLEEKRKQGFGGDQDSWFRDPRVIQDLKSIVLDGLIHEVPGVNARNYLAAVEALGTKKDPRNLHKSIWLAFSYTIWYSLFILNVPPKNMDL